MSEMVFVKILSSFSKSCSEPSRKDKNRAKEPVRSRGTNFDPAFGLGLRMRDWCVE